MPRAARRGSSATAQRPRCCQARKRSQRSDPDPARQGLGNRLEDRIVRDAGQPGRLKRGGNPDRTPTVRRSSLSAWRLPRLPARRRWKLCSRPAHELAGARVMRMTSGRSGSRNSSGRSCCIMRSTGTAKLRIAPRIAPDNLFGRQLDDLPQLRDPRHSAPPTNPSERHQRGQRASKLWPGNRSSSSVTTFERGV